jgi:putative ABC transport system permease protein
MQKIELTRLALLLIPAFMVIAIQWRWSLPAKTSGVALARMIIQLCLIGYVLTFIFASDNGWMIFAVLSVMMLTSSWIALRTVPQHRHRLFLKALLATSLVNIFLLLLITQFVLLASPWYQANIIIPLAGMIFATGMNSISLFAERFYSEIESGRDPQLARGIAYQATLIPVVNSLLAVGLVSLPGMMTGQILSGVSPLIAVRYQIMVMLMLFASSGLTTALFYKLIASPSIKQT